MTQVGRGDATELVARAGRVPGAEPALAAAHLSLLQRIILTTDGTVGRILEQFAGEAMTLIKLSQTVGPIVGGDSLLGVEEDERVLCRHVLLQGSRTRSNFLYAESLVRSAGVAPSLFREMVSSDVPLGYLLNQHRLETFREVLASGEEQAGECGRHFNIAPTEPLVFRTYRIFAGHRPIILITEKFPLTGPLSLL